MTESCRTPEKPLAFVSQNLMQVVRRLARLCHEPPCVIAIPELGVSVTLIWLRKCVEIGRLLRFVVAAVLICEALPALPVHAETTIVPSATVRSWYDTNVFRRPKQLLAPGVQPEDFAATVGAGLDLLHKSRDMEADVKVMGFYTAYVENTDRSFFETRLKAHVGLDPWADRYIRGARLSIRENLRFTPEQESFLGAGAREIRADDGLAVGVQGFRATQIRNTTDIQASYPVSRDFSVEGGYTFGLRSIGRVQGGDIPGVTFFDTMSHTWYGGPRYKLTRNDSVAALYRQSFITQSRSEGGRNFNTNIITLGGEYTKDFQEWTVAVQAGVTFLEPAGRTFPSGSLQVSTKLDRDTVLRLALLREGRPSYFLQGGATISNMATAGISHKIYERLILDGTVGYAYNQLFPDTDRTLQNLIAQSRLAYKLTRTITGEIFYLYQHVDSDSSSIQFQFSRNQVGFMLTAEWK